MFSQVFVGTQGRGVFVQGPKQRPSGQRPPGRETPQTETPLDREPEDKDPSQTETSQTRFFVRRSLSRGSLSGGGRGLYHRDPAAARTSTTEASTHPTGIYSCLHVVLQTFSQIIGCYLWIKDVHTITKYVAVAIAVVPCVCTLMSSH